MFANYPLAIQILGWAMFMGLNGYIGATCPGLNLAVLAFLGMFASRKVGTVLLVVAILITLAESIWFLLNSFAAGMSTIPQKTPAFLEQGTGILNLLIAGAVFFVLINSFTTAFASPKWLIITFAALFYLLGAALGVIYWIPMHSHVLSTIAVALLVGLCDAKLAPYSMGINVLIFLLILGEWGNFLIQENNSRKEAKEQERIDTAFLQAVSSNRQEEIASLWNSARTCTQREALEHALNTKNADMTRFLIKQAEGTNKTTKNKDFDAVKNLTNYALEDAIYKKELHTIKLLVQSGAPVGPYRLEQAAEENFLGAVQFFVERGVDINTEYDTPLEIAIEKNYRKMLEYLLNTRKNSQKTLDKALVKVCKVDRYSLKETDKIDIATLLLKYGAKADNHAGYESQGPLHEASARGTLELVKLLVSKGADVNDTTSKEGTPLMEAVKENHLEVATFLLQQGAGKTINQTFQDGNTALFEAKSAEMATLLINNGANPLHINKKGKTLLLDAIISRRNKPLSVFLDSGIDVNTQDNTGTTALIEAVKATDYGYDVKVVQQLLEKGANVNLADNKGNTPLLYARSLEVLQLLLEHGANVNAKNKEGTTILISIAKMHDHGGEKTKLLLEHGAEVNARDNNGKTALKYADHRNKHSWYDEKQIKILKQYGGEK